MADNNRESPPPTQPVVRPVNQPGTTSTPSPSRRKTPDPLRNSSTKTPSPESQFSIPHPPPPATQLPPAKRPSPRFHKSGNPKFQTPAHGSSTSSKPDRTTDQLANAPIKLPDAASHLKSALNKTPAAPSQLGPAVAQTVSASSQEEIAPAQASASSAQKPIAADHSLKEAATSRAMSSPRHSRSQSNDTSATLPLRSTSQNAQAPESQVQVSSDISPTDDAEIPATKIPTRHPFKNVWYLDHLDRSDDSRDPRYKVPRAGYDRHRHNDFDFWLNITSKGELHKVKFSINSFCEGFDITATQFYIVRYELMRVLFKDDLYQKLRKDKKKSKLSAVDAHYIHVEECISNHTLLDSPRVHGYWRRAIIKEFVISTAHQMRLKATPITNPDDSTSETTMFIPNRSNFASHPKFGPAAKHLPIADEDYPDLETISIELYSLTGYEEDPHLIRLEKIIPVDQKDPDSELSLDRADFSLLIEEVYRKNSHVTGDERRRYGVAYQNMYYGNAILLVEDDVTLRIALKALRIRGRCGQLMKFFFVCTDPAPPTEIEHDPDQSSADVSDTESWKSDGYASDACKERFYRIGRRVVAEEQNKEDDEWRADNRGSSEVRERQDDDNAAAVRDEMEDRDEAEKDKRQRNIQKEQAMEDQRRQTVEKKKGTEDQRLQAMEKEQEMADRTSNGTEKGLSQRDQVRKKGEHDDGSKKADGHLNRKRKSRDGESPETAPKRQRNDDTAPVGLEGEAVTPTDDTNDEFTERLKAHKDVPDSDVEMDEDEDQDKNDDTSKEESEGSDSDTTDDSLSEAGDDEYEEVAGDDEDEEALGSGDDV